MPADIYSYMVFSQFSNPPFIDFLNLGSLPPCHHTRAESEVPDISEPSYYLSGVIKREHPFNVQGYSCPQFSNRGLPLLTNMIHPASIYVFIGVLAFASLGAVH
jgi:hypothetical protein